MIRLAIRLAGALVGLLIGVGASGATINAALAADVVHGYNYDVQHHAVESGGVVFERGPPTTVDRPVTPSAAVDARSHGVSPRPQPASNLTYTTYAPAVQLVQVDRDSGTARAGSLFAEGQVRLDVRAGVAANSGRLSGRIVTEEAMGDVAIRNAMRVKPEPGMFDVIGHGTPSSVSGMSASELAGAIRARPGWAGQDIRLLSCSTGCPTGTFAQDLANNLGVVVRAPSTDIIVSSRGGITFEGGGGWRIFSPGG